MNWQIKSYLNDNVCSYYYLFLYIYNIYNIINNCIIHIKNTVLNLINRVFDIVKINYYFNII